MLSAVKGTS